MATHFPALYAKRLPQVHVEESDTRQAVGDTQNINVLISQVIFSNI